ncbi:serine/threonine-protein kinase [Streptomyces sp. NPDC006997]|uniref:serine/threonine-protein kinase n=1 Tax=Streptomyces sp. NPDC006997 TaxID=3155356 RepID=UPI0033C8B5F5
MDTWAVPGYAESGELGSGASGRVVLAVHEETDLPVAVKYLSESLRTRPGFVHGFRAEARLLGGLDSPYVARLFEYVESTHGAAIVMELVDGVSLRTLLRREGPLGPEAALTVLKGSLLGLADAHRVGVVHRDYKPENVLVAPDGSSRLVDFGIAVDAGTSSGVAGTPAYMAPEQWTGAPASPAADVYAATATFFECLTGHKPYPGDNLAELALQHVDAPVPADEAPEPVRDLVRRGLAKDPAGRPARADDFVRELETVAGGAYGPDWEDRGRGRLAALVALVPLLLPSGRGEAPRTTTDTARTVLAAEPGGGWGRSWLPGRPGLAVAGVAVLLGLLLAYGLRDDPGTAAPQGVAALALATTSAEAGGGGAPPGTGPSAVPGAVTDSPSAPTASADPTPSPPGTAAPPATGLTTAPEETATTTPPPSEPAGPPTTTPDAPVAPAVKDIAVSAFQQTGATTATATLSITTDGTGPVSVTVAWYAGDTAGQPGAPDGGSQTFERGGATRYTLTLDHAFQTSGCYWTVGATTSPASADGGAAQQLLTKRCDLR